MIRLLQRQFSALAVSSQCLNSGFNCVRNVSSNCCRAPTLYKSNLLKPSQISSELRRTNTSFYNKVSAEFLWKGVTSVSNAGRKRGRARAINRRQVKDLNKGQIIGVGKTNMVFPGLNSPVIRGKEVVQMQELPPDDTRDARLLKLRESQGKFRRVKLGPLERGWSGGKMHGRSAGPPDPVGFDTFEDFDTRILEMKTVTNMDGNIGRIKRFSVMCFTGNKSGLAGFAIGKNPEGRSAIRRAKNRAVQKLVYIQRYENHTVLHDFFTQFGRTKIFVFKKPEGFGLVCHRAIRTMCELIGIKDLYAKVEGPTNVQHICKAFMLGLLQQKTHEQMAKDKGLYLVEQRPENSMFPKILGIPEYCRSEDEIPSTEILDFRIASFDGRLPLKKKKITPFYVGTYGWEKHLQKTLHRRNRPQVAVKLLAEYGHRPGTLSPQSFVTRQFPEADAYYHRLLQMKKEAAEKEAEAE